MTDLIVKRPPISIEEAKARGATIVRDDIPGQGFAEDDTHDPRYDDPEVLDCEKRAQDAKLIDEVNEETLRLREESTNAVRKFRFNHQQDFVQWIPGRILNIGEFLGLLQKIRPDAFVAERQILGLQGLGFVQDGKPKYSGTSVQTAMPEWSQLKVDIHGLPTRERYRGWRTVLLACIKGDFITEAQCDLVFGKPNSFRSEPWYRQLWEIRNGKCGVCRKVACDCKDRFDFLRADKYQYEIPQDVMSGKQQRLEESRIWTP
jgi:hypothetical protein